MEDNASVELHERIVLHKYEGDLTEEEIESADPIETVVIENGKIIEHIIHEGG